MKKLIRLLWIEIAVVLVLAVALVVLLLNPPQTGEESYVLSQHAATDIVSIHLENEAGAVVVRAQDGGYLIEDVPAELVDIDAFIDFLVSCSEVTALQKIDAEKDSLADFGLAQPAAMVAVAYSDGETMLLSLGNQEPISGDYYCAVEGESGVYLLEEETASQYLIVKEQLISFYVTPELAVSSALSAVQDVTFSGSALEEPITIESVAAGDAQVKELARSFGAATHIVRGAGVYELDQSYGLSVLTPLCGMVGQSIVSYGLTPEQENDFGFGDPYLQVAFDYKNGTAEAEHYVLRFLPATEDGSFFYANAAGSGTIFVIERQPFFDISYDKLLLRWFVSPLLMDVTGITIEAGGERNEFVIDSTDAKNPTVTLNGEEKDIALFRKLFQLLGSAAADGDYLGVQPQPDEAPAMVITYHYSDGKADDVLALHAGETRRLNVFVNGVCEFAMRDAFAARVNDAVDAIQANAEFDVNW